jgi:hypothetical protein
MSAPVGHYVPEWSGSVEGYTVNQVTKALWRVAITHDRDDLMQEARIVFLKCERAYPAVDTPQHFMALYKTALANRINDLARKHTTIKDVSVGAADDHERGLRGQVGALDNDGYITAMVRQAPREIAMVLALFLNAPAELLELAENAWGAQKRQRESANAMIRRLLGPEVGERPIEQVESYFLRE